MGIKRRHDFQSDPPIAITAVTSFFLSSPPSLSLNSFCPPPRAPLCFRHPRGASDPQRRAHRGPRAHRPNPHAPTAPLAARTSPLTAAPSARSVRCRSRSERPQRRRRRPARGAEPGPAPRPRELGGRGKVGGRAEETLRRGVEGEFGSQRSFSRCTMLLSLVSSRRLYFSGKGRTRGNGAARGAESSRIAFGATRAMAALRGQEELLVF